MGTCPQCQTETTDDAAVCSECGTALETGVTESNSPSVDEEPGATLADADYDPEEERKRFERRYGIDIGDRTVDEYLSHLAQQDYSLTLWVGVVAITQIAGVALFTFDVLADLDLGVSLAYGFTAISVLMAVGIFGDTRAVGQFDPWAKIRWTYVLIAAVPLVGHIGAFLYLVLRRLMHEQAAEHRRRLLDAGFDVHFDTSGG